LKDGGRGGGGGGGRGGGGGGGGIQNQKQEPDTNNGEKSPAPKLRKISKRHAETSPIEHEAFVPDVPQKVKVEDVKTKLSCETSLKK